MKVAKCELRKASKIWAFAVIAQIDLNMEDETHDDLRKCAMDFAVRELNKLGVIDIYSIKTELDAINYVRKFNYERGNRNDYSL